MTKLSEIMRSTMRKAASQPRECVHLSGGFLGEEQVDRQREELVALLNLSVGNHASPGSFVLVFVYRVHLQHPD